MAHDPLKRSSAIAVAIAPMLARDRGSSNTADLSLEIRMEIKTKRSLATTNNFGAASDERTNSPVSPLTKIVKRHEHLSKAPPTKVRPTCVITSEDLAKFKRAAAAKRLPPPPTPPQSNRSDKKLPTQARPQVCQNGRELHAEGHSTAGKQLSSERRLRQSDESIITQLEWENKLHKSIESLKSFRGTAAEGDGLDLCLSELVLIGLKEKANHAKNTSPKVILQSALLELEASGSDFLAEMRIATKALLRKLDEQEGAAAVTKDIARNATKPPVSSPKSIEPNSVAQRAPTFPGYTKGKNGPARDFKTYTDRSTLLPTCSTSSKRQTDKYDLIKEDPKVLLKEE